MNQSITNSVTFPGYLRHNIIRNKPAMSTDLQRACRFLVHNLEAFVWITAIIYFALSPLPSGEHFTICPLSLAGFEHCPGCGLGRSMILLLHGHVSESFSMHPLAIFALGAFTARIVIVFRNYFKYWKQIATNE
jgi:hypothetical protein